MSDRADATDLEGEARPVIPTVAATVMQALAVGVAQLRDALEQREPLDAATVHATRIALRRVRTVLGIVDRAAPSLPVERVRIAARGLAGAIGAARDWDVFVTDTLTRHTPSPATDGHAALCRTAETLRRGAHAHFDGYRHGPDGGHFLAQLADLVARPGWRDDGSALWDTPLDALARPTLDRLHKRVLKRGRSLGNQDDKARHALRLAVKRLRYAMDLFAPVLDGDGRAGYRRRLVALQDTLGFGNDRATARRLAATVVAASDHPDIAAAVAALTARLDAADEAAEAELKLEWRRFRHRQTFWRDDG